MRAQEVPVPDVPSCGNPKDLVNLLNLLDEVEEQILKLNENDAWRLERERTFLLRKIEQQAKEDE